MEEAAEGVIMEVVEVAIQVGVEDLLIVMALHVHLQCIQLLVVMAMVVS